MRDTETVRPKLRIGYMVGGFPGLTETFIVREIEGLRKRGFEVTVFASMRSGDPVERSLCSEEILQECVYARPDSFGRHLVGNLKGLLAHPVRYLKTLGLYLRQAPYVEPAVFVRLLYHFFTGVGFAEDLRKRGIDHVHCHFAVACNIALAAHRFAGISYSFTVHASADIFMKALMLEEKTAGARFVVGVCEYSRRFLDLVTGYRHSDKLFRIYNGVDADESERLLGEPPRPRVSEAGSGGELRIVSVGSLRPLKGHPTLVKAVALAREKGLAITCHIIGEGGERPVLERLVAEAGLQESVILTGPLSLREVYELLRKADVFALLCEIGPSGYRDAFPTAILEAMALELPVVSTWISGVPEMVDHERTGILVPERRAESAAVAFERLCADPELRRRMGAAGRERLRKHFDPEQSTEQLARLMRDACTVPRTS